MANPNNLIRPPVLGHNTTPPPAQQISPDLANIIRAMVSQAIEASGPELVRTTLGNNNNPIIKDQTIEEQYRNNMAEMDKVPDVVRSLREFSGNASEFSSWKKSVERIIKIYEPSKGTPKFFGILNVIRNKIVGKADIALESYNTPLDWTAISRCLTTHYADKRDIGTLEYQMTCLIQGKSSINEFYQKVYSQLSLILNKIGCMEIGEEAVHLLTDNYRTKALDTFVRGLSGDLPRLLGIKEPKTLPEALHLCLKLENQSFRAHHANNQVLNAPSVPRHQSFNSFIPRQQPPMARQVQPLNSRFPESRFYPELAHVPYPQQTYRQPNLSPHNSQQYQNSNSNPHNSYQQQNSYNHSRYPYNQQPNYPPPRPPKPPQPMDVDESVRTRAVNYVNRPKPQETGKRPLNASMINHPPAKAQRNFHIDTNETNYDPYHEDQHYDQYDNTQQTAYSQEIAYNNVDKEPYDLTDVHFLD